MGIFGNVGSRIRNLMQWDKDRVALNLAKGNTSSTPPQSGFEILQSYGHDVLQDYLKIENDLMSRFVDAENMQEYPELSSALEAYADDCSQLDPLTNKTVWVDSPDRTIKEIVTDLYDVRLRLEEEAWADAHALCIAEGERVWTSRGPVPIEEINIGDYVQGYKNGRMTLFKVKNKFDNGIKDVWSIKTRHREIKATLDHKVLVHNLGEAPQWKAVKDLKMTRHPGGGVNLKHTDRIVISTQAPNPPEVPSWDELCDIEKWRSPMEWELSDRKIGHCAVGFRSPPKEIILPDRITIDFCRLYGFLIGDGNLNYCDYENASQVIYSRGVYQDLNDKYDKLLSDFGLDVAVNATRTTSVVCSVKLARLLVLLGFNNGSHIKRIPRWLGKLPAEYREAFLEGFIDADGWESSQHPQGNLRHFEIANIPLAYDLKNLINGLGYSSGNIKIRKKDPGFEIKGKIVKSTRPAATLTFSSRKSNVELLAENVKKISKIGEMRVYDLEVDDAAHNFVVEGVCVHNCMYGNSYSELLVTDDGLIGTNYLPAPTMRRIEGRRGELFGFLQDWKGRFGYSVSEFQEILAQRATQGNNPASNEGTVTALEDWEVVHARLRSKQRRSLYGMGVLDPGRWIWKRLMLLEDAAMIYELERTPQRYVFNVDVGDLPPKEAFAYLNKVRQQYKKIKFWNPTTQQLDMRHAPLDQSDDFFLAVRNGVKSSTVDVLNSPKWNSTETLDYFRLKLFAAIKVPMAYLGYADSVGKGTLSQLDQRFARSVLRVQRELRNSYKRMGRVHLAALNIDPRQVDFEVYMTVPGSIFELAQLEVRNAKADFAGRMSQFVSMHWILSKVFGLSEEEVEYVIKQRHTEAEAEAEVQAKALGLQMKEQGKVQNQMAGQQQAQLPAGNPMAASEDGDVKSPVASLSRIWPQRRQYYGYKPITEQELFRGHRDHEKLIEDNFEKMFKQDQVFANRITEIRELVHDLRATMHYKK